MSNSVVEEYRRLKVALGKENELVAEENRYREIMDYIKEHTDGMAHPNDLQRVADRLRVMLDKPHVKFTDERFNEGGEWLRSHHPFAVLAATEALRWGGHTDFVRTALEGCRDWETDRAAAELENMRQKLKLRSKRWWQFWK